MIDAITAARGEELHPELWRRYQALDDLVSAKNIVLRITQGLRTWPAQASLFAKGRSAPGTACTHNGIIMRIGECRAHPFGLTVTKAPPGYTWHNFGLALDAVPDDPALPGWQPDWNETHPAWGEFLRAAKTVGLAEGAEWRTFPDAPHLYPEELPPTPGDDVRQAFEEDGIKAVWELMVPIFRKEIA